MKLRKIIREYQILNFLKLVKGFLIDCWWQIRGKTVKNPPLAGVVSSIVFICKGNICRSAFAQYLANQIKQKNGNIKPLRIESAGLKARSGTESPEMAIEVAKDFGIEMELHRSLLLRNDMVDAADMIIAMEPCQVRAMQKKYTHRKQHIYLLPLFEDGWAKNYFGWQKYHIQDPYGKEKDHFIKCFKRIEACINGLMEDLKR